MVETVVRPMERGEARQVAAHVRRASRRLPDARSRRLGRLLPTWVLAVIYRRLQTSGRGEVWIARTPTAMAGVVGLRRGAMVEAVDFFSTGQMLGLTLALVLLREVDSRGGTVLLDAGSSARTLYFRRLGFEPAGGTRMLRRAQGSE